MKKLTFIITTLLISTAFSKESKMDMKENKPNSLVQVEFPDLICGFWQGNGEKSLSCVSKYAIERDKLELEKLKKSQGK